MSPEELEANVVLIFKKGNTAMFENYRPISLLNSIYKLKAALLLRRLERGVDPFLQKTQYGFRKDKSTSDAVYLIRRVLEFAEATQDRVLFLLLDWEKAFDKVRHEALFHTLHRMGVHEHLIMLVKSLYQKPQFTVTVDGQKSNTNRKLESGRDVHCRHTFS